MNIAIQGILGSFHHIVAHQYFGEGVTFTECLSFDEIPQLINTNKVDGAVMAIENTLAGSILSNYALINEFDLEIQGEIHLPIQHNLMALEGQNLSDIKEVWSHPMAILQCRKFFRDYPAIRLVEASDTADVARNIQGNKIRGVAAIASKMAAEIYNLKIIESKIQTRDQNYTRFFILKKKTENGQLKSNVNKASLRFVTHHLTGSLSDVLGVFSEFNMNLSKIQSLPIIDTPWNYAFFVDVIFEDDQQFQQSIEKIKKKVLELKVLGKYKQSKRNYAS